MKSYLKQNAYREASLQSAEVASSLDLGFTYGRYRSTTTAGYYVRVWKMTSDDGWQLVLDVTTVER